MTYTVYLSNLNLITNETVKAIKPSLGVSK